MSYAGDITAQQAWKILNDNPDAVLVDVRTDTEWRVVGVPDLSSLGRDVICLEWHTSDGRINENFVAELRERIPATGEERPVVFLCRSGGRSCIAAQAATEAGLTPAYNVLDGFEGHVNAGWRATGLPCKEF